MILSYRSSCTKEASYSIIGFVRVVLKDILKMNDCWNEKFEFLTMSLFIVKKEK